MPNHTIANPSEIPAAWGPPRLARRKGTVTRREPTGIEHFERSWGRLTAQPGIDWVLTTQDGESYPIKRDLFHQTYEAVSPSRYRKTTLSRLVQVPPGATALLKTLEGDLVVHHPDYIAIGPTNEVYANKFDWVNSQLEWLPMD